MSIRAPAFLSISDHRSCSSIGYSRPQNFIKHICSHVFPPLPQPHSDSPTSNITMLNCYAICYINNLELAPTWHPQLNLKLDYISFFCVFNGLFGNVTKIYIQGWIYIKSNVVEASVFKGSLKKYFGRNENFILFDSKVQKQVLCFVYGSMTWDFTAVVIISFKVFAMCFYILTGVVISGCKCRSNFLKYS